MMKYWSRFLLVTYVVVVLSHHHVDSFHCLAITTRPCRSLPSPGGCYKNTRIRNNDNNNNSMRERIRPTAEYRMINDQKISSLNVDIYNEKGEEIDIEDDIPLSDNEIEMTYATDEIEEDTLNNKRKKIDCSASIMLPFSADVAFTAFSDLTRQPSWCKYLHSVEYIGLVSGSDDNDGVNNDVPLRSSKWTVGVKGLRFSWTASDTRIIRNKRIEWASNSGLKNVGSVVFTPSSSSASDSTHMELCFTFILPRVVSSLYRRLNIRKYTEDVMLADMLQRFRDVVIEEDL